MAFNGSGTFNLIYNWQNDAAQSLNISSSRMQGQDADIAAGLSLCITKDGQQTPVANLPMGGFKLTNMGNATQQGNATTVQDVQNAALITLGSVSGTNTIAALASPAIAAYADAAYWFTAAGANTGAVTLNINALGAKNVFGLAGNALQGGEIAANGKCLIAYSTALGAFVLLGCSGGALQIPNATQSEHALPLGQVQQNYAWNAGYTSITGTGSFTVAAGVYRLRYRVWGGGGGGGGCAAAGNSCGGGGGGGYVEGTLSVTPGATVSCTIGAAGAGGGAGGSGAPGGTTSFTYSATTVQATGGQGGGPNTAGGGNGGTGGGGSGGILNLSSAGGGSGGTGSVQGGMGGGAPLGGTGGSGAAGVGGAGGFPGGGGGGHGGGSTGSGGGGAQGAIVFEW